MKLIEKIDFEVLDGFGSGGEFVKLASDIRNSKSGAKVKDSASYIKMLKKQDDKRDLFFSWYVLHIVPKVYSVEEFKDLTHLFEKQKSFNVTVDNNNSLIVSGTGLDWLDFLTHRVKQPHSYDVYNSIAYTLNHINENLFEFNVQASPEYLVRILNIDRVKEMPKVEREKHLWIGITAKNVSRYFIQDVLIENNFICVASDKRFDIEKDFSMLLNLDFFPAKHIHDKIKDCLSNIQQTYNYIINSNMRRDIASTLLPLGVASDMLITGTLGDWKDLIIKKNSNKNYYETEFFFKMIDDYFKKDFGFN